MEWTRHGMSREGFVTADLRFRSRYALAEIGADVWWFTFPIMPRRNNSYIYLGTSTGRSPRKFIRDEFFMDRPGEGFTAPPGDGPTTSLHYKMDGVFCHGISCRFDHQGETPSRMW